MRCHWLPSVGIIAITLGAGGVPRSFCAETAYDLSAAAAPGDLARVEVLLEADGELKLDAGGQEEKVPMKVVGKLAYDQKLLSPASAGQSASQAIRYYRRADATLGVANSTLQPSLREDRRLVGVEGRSTHAALYGISGPLTRDELDLIEAPGDSLLVARLLPKQRVSIGDTWQPSDDTMAGILGIHAVGNTDVTCKLTDVTERVAKIDLAGHVDGAVDGVATEIEVKGKLNVNLDRRQVTWFTIVSREKRSVGHATPGLEVVARLQMKISPLSAAPELADVSLPDVSLAANPALGLLSYESPTSPLVFLYDRDWQIIGEESDRVALRLLNRGELVAQCNVTLLPPAKPGERTSLTKFQGDIEKALGDHFGQFLAASENVSPEGRAIYRVVVAGEVSELPIRWEYYLVANDQGRQAVFAFTCEDESAELFGVAGQQIIETVEFRDAHKQPTEARATDRRSAPQSPR